MQFGRAELGVPSPDFHSTAWHSQLRGAHDMRGSPVRHRRRALPRGARQGSAAALTHGAVASMTAAALDFDDDGERAGNALATPVRAVS